MKYKTQKTKYVGEGNPNFNRGNTHNNKCIDCGIHITKNSTRCKSCSKKGNLSSVFKGGKPKCEICGKLLSAYNVKRCLRCEYDRRIKEEIFKDTNNPNYIHGNGYAPYPSEFNSDLKELIRKRDGYICQNCSMTEEEHLIVYGQVLHIHHIDYNKQNCKEDNLISLCFGCNIRANSNRNYWLNIFKQKIFLYGI